MMNKVMFSSVGVAKENAAEIAVPVKFRSR